MAAVLFGMVVAPVYAKNRELKKFLSYLVNQPQSLTEPEDLLRVRVLNKASELRLPVHSNQVVIKRSRQRVRIEIVYAAPVKLWPVTINLHFHAGVGDL